MMQGREGRRMPDRVRPFGVMVGCLLAAAGTSRACATRPVAHAEVPRTCGTRHQFSGGRRSDVSVCKAIRADLTVPTARGSETVAPFQSECRLARLAGVCQWRTPGTAVWLRATSRSRVRRLLTTALATAVCATAALAAAGAAPEREVFSVQFRTVAESVGAPPVATGMQRSRVADIDLDALVGVGTRGRDGVAAPQRLTLNLFGATTAIAEVEARLPTASGGYVLTGGIADDPLGTFAIVVNGDTVAGTVRTRGRTYRLRPAGPGRVTIGELDPAAQPDLRNDVVGGDDTPGEHPPPVREEAGARGADVAAPPATVEGAAAGARVETAAPEVLASERAALVSFHDATGGDTWTEREHWLGERPVGEWHGVGVHEDGRVRSLTLDRNGLAGTLPTFAGLDRLEQMVVAWNTGLTGELPDGLRRLADLTRLDWSGSELCAPRDPAFQAWLASIDYTGVTCPPDAATNIDVAVVYTPGAVNAFGGQAATVTEIDLMVAEANQTFRRGDVPLQLTLAATDAVSYDLPVGGPFGGLSRVVLRNLTDPADGYMDEVHDLRNRAGADLVVLVAGGAGGAAWEVLVPRPDFETEAFAVVGVDGHDPARTFAHEVGHLMGLSHDRHLACDARECALEGAFTYAYGYTNQRAFEPGADASTRWYTVMAYGVRCEDTFGDSCRSIMRYSSADQVYPEPGGDPLGVPGIERTGDAGGPADAVRTLRRTRETVANFRTAETRTVALEAVGARATEGGAAAVLTVRLDQAADSVKVIRLQVTGVGGASVLDYRIPSHVRFDIGEVEKTVEVEAIDDAADDDGESVLVGLDNLPPGLAVRAGPVAVALVDDDELGDQAATGPRVLSVTMTSTPRVDPDVRGDRDRYLAADRIEFAARFNQHVTITGTPALGLHLCGGSRQATYSRAAGEVVYFAYTVGDTDAGPCRDLAVAANSLTVADGDIRDASGRDFQSAFAAVVIDPAPLVDGVKPVLERAVAFPFSVVLTYSEPLFRTSLPHASLRVWVNGKRYGTTEPRVAGRTLSLLLYLARRGEAPPVMPGDVLTARYSLPSWLGVRDEAGNYADAAPDLELENASFLGRDNDRDRRIEIATPAQLDVLRHDPDGDGVPTADGEAAYTAAFPDARSGRRCERGCIGYELLADIDLDTNGDGAANAADAYWNAGAGWLPIDGGGFNAVFDGNGHAVRGLFVDRPTVCAGLFGSVGRPGRIRRVAVIAGRVTGEHAGLVAGCLAGRVEVSYASGHVEGRASAGGLVGASRGGRIDRAYAAARVSVAPAAGSAADVAAGGLVGRAWPATIEASYATGEVDADSGGSAGGLVGHGIGGRIAASYAAAHVRGAGEGVGGVVGTIDGMDLHASYVDADVSGAGAGEATLALQAPAGYWGLYADWNVDSNRDGRPDTPWDFRSDRDYPALVADFDADGRATWQEFGHQLRAGPRLTAAAVSAGGVVLRWSPVTVDDWSPPPPVTYAVARENATGRAVLAADVTGLEYALSAADAAATDSYRVAAVVDGALAARSALVASPLGEADATVPRVASLTSDATHPTNTPFRVTIAFSEPVAGLAADAVSVTGGTGSDLAGGDGVWTLDIVPDPDFHGEVTVALAADAARDAAGNGNEAASGAFAVDTLAPTLDDATVSGTTLRLVWNEPLDESSVPGPAAFTVSGRTAKAVGVVGKVVRVDFAPAVAAGQEVDWAYEPSAVDALKDAVGNAAPAQTGRTARPADPVAGDASLEALELGGMELPFDPARTGYRVDVPHGTAVATVVATPTDPGARVTITPGDADAQVVGSQVRLKRGETTIRIHVLSASGWTERTYTVRMVRAWPPLTARFEGLPARHDGGSFEFDLIFSEVVSERDYRGAMTFSGVAWVSHIGSSYGKEKLITVAPDGDGPIRVTLTARDGNCRRADVVCTANSGRPDRHLKNSLDAEVAGPRGRRASVAHRGKAVIEGGSAMFAVQLDRAAPDEGLTVGLEVRESGRMLSGPLPEVAVFGAGETETTVSLATENDLVVERDSVVSVTPVAGTGYVPARAGRVVVADDDVATLALSASPSEVRESGSGAVTVRVAGGVTFADDQRIALDTWGTASPGDYALAPVLTLAAGATLASTALEAVDDDAAEEAEWVTVSARLDRAEFGSTTVTIPPSDQDASDDVRLVALALAGVDLRFQPATWAYTVDADEGLTRTTVTAAPSNPEARIEIAPGDADAEAAGHQVALSRGPNTIAVTVRAVDGETTRTYSVTVRRGETPLAAWFENAPEVHDGRTMFQIGLRFGEEVEMDPDRLRNDVLEKTGGRVTAVRRRAWGSNRDWQIDVTPSGEAEVVLTVPAGVPCGQPGAVCTARDKPLFERAEIRIPGHLPTATLSAGGDVIEGAAAVFEVAIDKAPTAPLTVAIAVSETGNMLAGPGPTSVAFAAGETRRSVEITTVDDGLVEVDSVVTAVLSAGSGYALGVPSTAELSVTDQGVARPPVATLVAAGAVVEGAPALFEVILDRRPGAPLSVAVSVAATAGVLAGTPPTSVAFAAGATRATFAVATAGDTVVEGDGSVTATLAAGEGYTLGSSASAAATVMDDDAAVFAVTAAPDLIEEGGTATVTLAITNGTTFAAERTVSLSVSGLEAGSYTLEPATAVLAAGATSLAAAFTALEDGEEDVPRTARVEAVVDTSVVGTELTVEDVGPAPRIAGVPQVGAVLKAEVEGAGPAAYQWLRDGTSIIGAAAREYVPVAADAATALSVRVQARGRERTSTATVPVWPAPANPPLAAAEEELLGTTLTLGSRTFGVGVAGFSRLPGREFGSVEDAAFALGDRELTLFMVNKWGNMGLAATPPVADAAGLTAYWNEYGIGSLRAVEVDDTPAWAGRTPQPPEEFERYVAGASDGVRVAVSLRRPLPAATLSALSGTVPEGSAATFEVALDRAAWSARTVSLSVEQDGAVLAEAAPVSVAFAAGESRATVTLATVDDAVIEGDVAVTATLVAGDGYVLGEETSASVTVTDDDVAVFAVSASPGTLDEGGSATVAVSIANGLTFAEAQSIELSASGSASASDYRLSPATLALPVGETSAAATLTAVADVEAEPDEAVTVTVRHAGSVVGSATLTIRANTAPPPPVARVSAVSGTVTEGAPLRFEVALDTAALQPLTVAATVSETRAVLSGAAPAAVEFAVGERTRTLVLATSNDAVVETDTTVTVALGPGDGYVLGSGTFASATVLDDDAAVFAVSAAAEEIDEGGSSTLTVSIANGVTFAADQSIALSVSGSASAADYVLAPETPTLAAGATSVEATLTAVDDADEESAETATVTATHGGLEVGSATVAIRASDIPSDDASLASLVLSDVDIGTFSPEATDYAAQVPSGLSSTTVTATANDAGAVVEIADAVGSTLGATRTVRLEEGGNAIAVTVAAEDGATTRAYRVAVTRAYAAAWGEPLPERDIELGAGSGPTGLWSDGETLWVVWDWRSGAVRAYDLDDGSLLAERGFEVAGGSGFPSGLWSDGTTLWVSDFHGGVTAHRLSDGARLSAEDLDGDILSAAGNSGPSGLWSDGTTLWVADDRAWKAFAYRLSDKSRLASREVGFHGDGDPVSPWGLWSDGETLLVSDPRRGMLHGYRLSDGARQAERTVDLSTVGIRIPMGLWSDGRVLWVAGERETTVRAYAVPGLRRAAAGTFPVRVSSRAPRVPGGAQGGRSVGIPDAALRARIAAALGKPADAALGERELAALTALDARAAGVADLTGLRYAVHLAALDLGDNALVDLRALADLAALTVLNLDRTGADPRSLARLTGLRRLSLRGNGLGDVRALRSLTALRVLDIGANRVEDLAPLTALGALEALRADGNPLVGDAPLASLDRLVELDVGSTPLADPVAERRGERK